MKKRSATQQWIDIGLILGIALGTYLLLKFYLTPYIPTFQFGKGHGIIAGIIFGLIFLTPTPSFKSLARRGVAWIYIFAFAYMLIVGLAITSLVTPNWTDSSMPTGIILFLIVTIIQFYRTK